MQHATFQIQPTLCKWYAGMTVGLKSGGGREDGAVMQQTESMTIPSSCWQDNIKVHAHNKNNSASETPLNTNDERSRWNSEPMWYRNVVTGNFLQLCRQNILLLLFENITIQISEEDIK
jgi:hypothetical protein